MNIAFFYAGFWYWFVTAKPSVCLSQNGYGGVHLYHAPPPSHARLVCDSPCLSS